MIALHLKTLWEIYIFFQVIHKRNTVCVLFVTNSNMLLSHQWASLQRWTVSFRWHLGQEMQVCMQLIRSDVIGEINDAHRMFWIFSSWCVKGELELWDSRLGTPRGRRGRETEDSSDIHLMLQCLSLVWTVSGGGRKTQANTQRDTHKHYAYMHTKGGTNVRGEREEYLFLLICRRVQRCLQCKLCSSPVISRTVRNTLSFSGSKASMLWYTSLWMIIRVQNNIFLWNNRNITAFEMYNILTGQFRISDLQ